MAIERVYVVKELYDVFVREVIEQTRRLKVGYTAETGNQNDVGPLTFQRQIDIIEDHVQDALAKGAKIVAGGRRDGMFMEPTVMVGVDHTMRLMRDETFGPIMPVMKVDDETHAIQLANDSNFGLSASVWSGNLERAQRVAHQLRVGSVNINDTMTHFAIPRLPFGGIKESGIGRTHGEKDLRQFAQTRAYAVGRPPLSFDVATLMRAPGNYRLGATVMRLAFGVTPKQRLQPVREALAQRGVKPAASRVAAAAGLTALLAAAVLGLLRSRR